MKSRAQIMKFPVNKIKMKQSNPHPHRESLYEVLEGMSLFASSAEAAQTFLQEF